MKYIWEPEDIDAGLVVQNTGVQGVTGKYMIGYDVGDFTRYQLIAMSDGMINGFNDPYKTKTSLCNHLNKGNYRPIGKMGDFS